MGAQKVVLVSSGQPSLNPRLVKEADALHDAGYEVTVIYLYWNDWATKADEKLFSQRAWKVKKVGFDPATNKLRYFGTRIVYKIARKFCQVAGISDGFAELALGRAASLLSKAACDQPADLYIGHNLAALPAVVKAAKKNNAKCGFDAEDFHRNESTDIMTDFNVKLAAFIEEKYIPQVNCLTASSPEIALKYQQLFPSKNANTILNVFPKNRGEKSATWHPGTALKLFWFSQSVGLSRGIQDVIASMKILQEKDMEFHILGSLVNEVKSELEAFVSIQGFDQSPKIIFHDPIDPDKLIEFASQFDIGLATEPGFSTNNNIALSNKLFTYINAGLAIGVSDTLAQSNFLAQNPEVGFAYKRNDIDSLANNFKRYLNEPDLLNDAKKKSYQIGQAKYNWENEQVHLLQIISYVLNDSDES